MLSPLAIKVVRASAGEIVSLPYSDHTALFLAIDAAVRAGYVVRDMEDDQPTTIATDAGRAYLAGLVDRPA